MIAAPGRTEFFHTRSEWVMQDKTFREKPLREQRWLLGLPAGQNPPAPADFVRPAGVNVPK
jgi:hypothetical protein